MEPVKSFFWELLAGVLGIVLTMLTARAGAMVKRVSEEAKNTDNVSFFAKLCVLASQQINHTLSGEEKMKFALSNFSAFLKKRGISLSEEEMRVYLESAVAEFKGAFDREGQ